MDSSYPSYSRTSPSYTPSSPVYSHTSPTYTPLGGYYVPELCLRFPEERETRSLDARFDQSPGLKKILDYYVDAKPSLDIGCQMSTRGVERKIDCSGLIIDWSSSENEATILTSAKLLWNEKDSTFEFSRIVRMTDGTLLLAKEDYVDYYHNVLTMKVKSTVEQKSVVWPWFRISVVDLDQLSYQVWEKLNISPAESYVVVKEVSEGSLADKNDVRPGDLVATCNGILIQSSKQYYRILSETSQAMTCGNWGGQSFKVVIKPYDRRTDNISIEADKVSVDDKRFNECWPKITAYDWISEEGKLRNPEHWDRYHRYHPTEPTYTPC
ncbi:hypothetical protein AgCh_029891 [Apium graveolens]